MNFVRKDIPVEDPMIITMGVGLPTEGRSQSAFAREFKTCQKFMAAQVERVEGA